MCAQVYGTDDIRYIKAWQDCDSVQRLIASPAHHPGLPPHAWTLAGDPAPPSDADPCRRPPAVYPLPHGFGAASAPMDSAVAGALESEPAWEWTYHGDPAGPIAIM